MGYRKEDIFELTNLEFWGIYDLIIQDEQIKNYENMKGPAFIIAGINNMLGGRAKETDFIGELKVKTLFEILEDEAQKSKPESETRKQWREWAEKNGIPYHIEDEKLIIG